MKRLGILLLVTVCASTFAQRGLTSSQVSTHLDHQKPSKDFVETTVVTDKSSHEMVVPTPIFVVKNDRALLGVLKQSADHGISYVAKFKSDFGRHWVLSSGTMLIIPTPAGVKALGTNVGAGIMYMTTDPVKSAKRELANLKSHGFIGHPVWQKEHGVIVAAYVLSQEYGNGHWLTLFNTPPPAK